MALDATELTYLRDVTGGRTNTNDDDHLTDAELQAMYTRAGDVWDTAVVLVLRRRLGMASRSVDKSMDLNSSSMSQYVEHLRDLLEDAEAIAGMQPVSLHLGTLDLGLDYDASDHR